MDIVSEPIRELKKTTSLYRERTRVGIVSRPGRESSLMRVLQRLAPQTDEVFVYLANKSYVPLELSTVPSNVRFFTGPDIGDKARFVFLKDFIGYYIPASDDFNYPRYHVATLLSAIDRSEKRAVVGWRKTKHQLPQLPTLHQDQASSRCGNPVDVLDTKTCALHTDSLRSQDMDYKSTDSAELMLSRAARARDVMLIALTQEAAEPVGSLQEISTADVQESSAPSTEAAQVTSQSASLQSPFIEDVKVPLEYDDKPRITVIGRANTRRWKKGGILKSVLLTKEMLNSHGCSVDLIDIEDGDVFDTKPSDLLMVYVGDPERPDFEKVHRIVEYHASRGLPVLVNLSEDDYPRRTTEIKKVMQGWYRRYAGLVSMMTFSQNVDSKSDYRNFRDAIVTLPKTLTFSHQRFAEFESSSGIFVGDVAKLSDPRIVGPNVQTYIDQLRAQLPEAKIFGIQQYKPKYKIPTGIDEVWPFMPAEQLMARLVNVRLMVSFPRYATYEMVPVEASALGVPLLYQDMPQSLNETIGLAGVRYKSGFELVQSAKTLYRDPQVWRQFSRAGIRRARSQDFDVASAQMYLQVKNFIGRFRRKGIEL